jgi:hypothetical protein
VVQVGGESGVVGVGVVIVCGGCCWVGWWVIEIEIEVEVGMRVRDV